MKLAGSDGKGRGRKGREGKGREGNVGKWWEAKGREPEWERATAVRKGGKRRGRANGNEKGWGGVRMATRTRAGVERDLGS